MLVERSEGDDLVCKQALEFLRVAEVWKGDPRRVAREAEAMRVLQQVLEPEQVPALRFEDSTEHLIGMDAVPQPHENWKHTLLRGEVDLDLVAEFGRILGAMHATTSARAGELATRFDDRSQFETLRVDPYYRFAAHSVPESADWISALIDETGAVRVALVHGDFSPKNVLVHNGSCVLLDHEVAHWGDPAFDVGFATAHFLGKATHLKEHRDTFATAAVEFWRSYVPNVEATDWFDSMPLRAVRHGLACTLARVAGKSPLEYLTGPERARQRAAAVRLISSEPRSYEELVERYVEELDR